MTIKLVKAKEEEKKKLKKSVLQLATFAKSKINSSSKRQEINERKVILKEGLNQRKNGKWKKVNKSNIALLDVEFFFQSLKNKANITCLLCGNQISYKSNEFVNRAMSKVSFTCSNGFSKNKEFSLFTCSSIHISGTQKKVPLANIQICAAALVSGVNNDQLTKLLMCLGINSLSENSRKKLTDIIGGKLLDFFDKNMKKYKSKEKELTVKLGLGKEGITLIVDGTYTKRSNGFTMDSPTCLVPQHQFDLISQSHNIDFSQFRHLLRSPK